MVQMLLCSRPRWSMMKIFEACVLRRRLAVQGNQEEAEKLGRGWKGQANLKEEKGKGKNGGRREGGRRSRENNWGGGGGAAFLSNPLLQPRSSPSCAEPWCHVDLCRPPCHAWSAAAMGQDGADPTPP